MTKSPNDNAFPSVSLFAAETTGPIFTKILHTIVALVALFNHAYTAFSHSLSQCQSDESAEFAIFSQNWLPW